ncbi:MAG TPA: class I SAM-dependent methyltransferase [Candidatus Dormibacteraeota bacterium]|nr:class I SAM-dependent methyltransferase [Candidatus Dormibacteraeota bacterium]
MTKLPAIVSLAEFSSSLSQIVQEESPPSVECPEPQLWSMYDGMATEVEVLQFLYALIRMLKPATIIETGTYLGYGTAHLALAAAHNDLGCVHTAEPKRELALSAENLFKRLDLSDRVRMFVGPGIEMMRSADWGLGSVDFAFLDSDCGTRIEEMTALLPHLHEGSVVAVHDTSLLHQRVNLGPRVPFKVFASNHDMEVMNFNTPRGLMLLRKRPQYV